MPIPPTPPGAPPPPDGVPPPTGGAPTEGVLGVGVLGTDTLGVEGTLGTVTLGAEGISGTDTLGTVGAVGAVIVGRMSGTDPIGGVNGLVGTGLFVTLLGKRLGDGGLRTLGGFRMLMLPVVVRGATFAPPVPPGFVVALSRSS